jgi:hypothetical protein
MVISLFSIFASENQKDYRPNRAILIVAAPFRIGAFDFPKFSKPYGYNYGALALALPFSRGGVRLQAEGWAI